MAHKVEVMERGSDMVLAAHRTPVRGFFTRAVAARILEYGGELGADLWAAGRWWGEQVARKWETAVRSSLTSIKDEAQRRAGTLGERFGTSGERHMS